MNSVFNRTAGALIAFATAGAANAAGFEKSIIFGGRSAGVAGIASPYAEGADALYFNPAGLATEKSGNSLSFYLSPTSSQFKGPINNQNTEVTSEAKTLLPFSLMYGRKLNEEWGMGVGFFVSGGSNATYSAISFPNSTYTPDVKTDLQILEVSAGAGYKANDKWKFGAAWRVVMAQADFAFVQRASATGIANAKLTGLKDTQAVAFRLGAQYKATESTDLSLTFRSEATFKASGKAQVTSFSSAGGAGSTGAEQDATAYTTFPMAITLGALNRMSDDWNLMGEYVWTQYSRIGEITVDSAAFATSGGSTRLKTDWRDQHNIRVGAEYLSPWPVRFGYVFTSVVTNSDYARASFTPPGMSHTLTVGTGKEVMSTEGSSVRIDGAFEYSMSSGDSTNGTASGTTGVGTDTRAGSFAVSAYAFHLGLSYLF